MVSQYIRVPVDFILVRIIHQIPPSITPSKVYKAAIKAASPNAPKAPECAIAVCTAPESEEAVAAPLFALPEL